MRRATQCKPPAGRGAAISIHALLAESDAGTEGDPLSLAQFLSTLSLRRATRSRFFAVCAVTNFYPRSPCGERHLCYQRLYRLQDISIHALLAESDRTRCHNRLHRRYFYPRSPCGERPAASGTGRREPEFLSTLSLRRATEFQPAPALCPLISIHALLAESDNLTPGAILIVL